MIWLLLTPFFLQALLIFFDEGYYHLKRGLPRFERIGHPLDTLTVITCLLFSVFVPYSDFALKAFVALALFSCFFVTKDEFVHKEHCKASEMWLHALLFINHPFLLGSLICLWMHQHHQISWLEIDQSFIKQFVSVQLILTSLFFCYQVVYWNFIRQPLEDLDVKDQ